MSNAPYALLFAQGFGLSNAFWEPMHAVFKTENIPCLLFEFESEYFSLQNRQKASAPLIGIGHSFGFLKLLKTKLPFKALVGVNAFTHFLGRDPSFFHKRHQEYTHFRNQIARGDPKAVLRRFYRQCGLPRTFPFPEQISRAQLQQEIAGLVHPHPLPETTPILILASQNDTVVPPALVMDNFQGIPNVNIRLYADGAHALGFYQAEHIAREIIWHLTPDT